VYPAVELDLFPLLDSVPSHDEIFVFRIGGCRVAGQSVTVLHVPQRICQMRGRGVTAVCQYGLEKGTTVTEFGGVGYGRTVQGNATLNEERVQKIRRRYRFL